MHPPVIFSLQVGGIAGTHGSGYFDFVQKNVRGGEQHGQEKERRVRVVVLDGKKGKHTHAKPGNQTALANEKRQLRLF